MPYCRENLYAKKGISSIAKTFSLTLALLKILLAHRRNISVCHVFCTSDKAFLRDAWLILLCRAFKLQVVAHLHSKTHSEYFVKKSRIFFLAKTMNQCRKVAVLSPKHLDFFEAYITKDRMFIFENFVFTSDFDCIKEKKSKTDFLYVGRLTIQKGFKDLLLAVKIIAGTHPTSSIIIHCLGAAEDEDRQIEINKQASKFSSLQLHGSTVDETKIAFFKRCSALIFPSHLENSPVVLKEAMAAKMYIVASNLAENMEVLKDYPAKSFFNVGDHEMLAREILSAAIHPSKLNDMLRLAQNGIVIDNNHALNSLIKNQIISDESSR